MPLTTVLEEALEAWHYTRAGVISEIRNLPDASLTFRPTPASRTAAEIAVHIAGSGLMMAGELSRADGNFQRKSFPQFMKEYARGVKATSNRKQLIALLTKTHEDYHRGQLALYARLVGRVPALTQLIYGKKK